MRRRHGVSVLLSTVALALLSTGSLEAQAVTPASGARLAEMQERLMHDLRALAADSMQGRAPGTQGAEMARRHLRQRLAELGLEAAEDTFAVARPGGDAVSGVNLRVTLPGTEVRDAALVLMAHYDHVGVQGGQIYNGADDNASGTAGLLELARGLMQDPPRHTFILLFLDAEESGLRGARHFVADPSVPLEEILVAVNLDMVAHADSVLWVAGTHPWPALRRFVDGVRPVPPVQLKPGHDTPQDVGADNWVSASDHAAFHREGIPFLYFGVADHPDYHQPTDDVERINPAFFTAAVETVRRVVSSLDRELDGRRP